MAMPGQDRVLAILADPATHGGQTPQRIDTHISAVFLTDARAYKLKRAVKFPFLDFSTLERREESCRAELTVNRAWAPDIYLGVEKVTADGLGGAGDALDWIVVMRRFDGDGLWDARAARGLLDPRDMRLLADVMADVHTRAKAVPAHGGVDDAIWVADGNAEDLAKLFDPAIVATLAGATRAEIERHRRAVEARRRAGHVRRCHGDLHLRNICTIDGVPVPFDGIEFDDRVSCIDTLYDLAFPIFDLIRIDRRDLANALLARYLQRRPDEAGLALLPLFLSLRAAIAAKTRGFSAANQKDKTRATRERDIAESCLALALSFLTARPAPVLAAVGGLSGSGKSAVAAGIAPLLGVAPGALILRTDVERKRLAGVTPEAPLPPESYTREASRAVYDGLFARVRAGLAAGHSVVVDAVFADPAERQAMRDIAAAAGVCFQGLWLDCPEELRLARVAGRKDDASDAGVAVAAEQTKRDVGDVDWRHLDAAAAPENVLAAARRALDAGQYAAGD
jgi:uncharacterized protein